MLLSATRTPLHTSTLLPLPPCSTTPLQSHATTPLPLPPRASPTAPLRAKYGRQRHLQHPQRRCVQARPCRFHLAQPRRYGRLQPHHGTTATPDTDNPADAALRKNMATGAACNTADVAATGKTSHCRISRYQKHRGKGAVKRIGKGTAKLPEAS